ncbi:chemotaxis protein CheX [Limnoglobus roseus]|uniref:Chemotaxis protein CheX n=1 Tax=Limnoglobus roseus TaxID=2598579 RepID=A0A5C1A3X1_9BACT|nr:chemotaxis protein CheX [Limnoglobus roseus]QEL13781.1 chemotaxis protein CheX [Limnoglobus roseus]
MLAPSFETSFPPAVTEAATAGIEITLDSILGERPVRVSPAVDAPEGPMLAAIISFIGEMKWSLTLMVTEPVGVALVERFCGLKLPFDGEDMADAIGEIVNVIAGEVTLQLEKRRMRGRMSLPTVVRGQALQLIANRSAASYRVAYRLSFGDFSVRFLAAGTSLFARLPGK